jgi:acyl-CoA reductase-like NAD-dependent aldehyde dehydrogenase
MAINGASDSGSLITVPLHINGQDVTTEHTYDVINPGTGKVIWRAASASKRDAINAVETAQAAFPAWSRTKPAQRRDILLKAADILSSRGDELAQYMIEETGSGAPFALGFNIPITVEMLKDVAGRISGICGTAPVCQDDNTSAIVYKVPYGVILGIAPW